MQNVEELLGIDINSILTFENRINKICENLMPLPKYLNSYPSNEEEVNESFYYF